MSQPSRRISDPTSAGVAGGPGSVLGYSATRPRRGFPFLRLIGLAAGLLMLLIAYRISSRPRAAVPILTPSTGPVIAPVAITPPAEPSREEVARVYHDDIGPALNRYERRNQEALNRAVRDLQQRIDGRRSGIQPFVADINRWGTRGGVVFRKAVDFKATYWDDQPENLADEYISDKFRFYVYSEYALKADLNAVVRKYQDDLRANRGYLYSEVKEPLQKIKIPLAMSATRYDEFEKRADESAALMLKGAGTDSVMTGTLDLIGSTIAMDAGARLAQAVLTRVGAVVLSDGIVVGATEATGAGSGAAVGSLGGPAGTIVCAGVGLAAGCVVDWWMTKEFSKKMNLQLNAYFDDLQEKLVYGGNNKRAWPGLKKIGKMRTSCRMVRSVRRLLRDWDCSSRRKILSAGVFAAVEGSGQGWTER